MTDMEAALAECDVVPSDEDILWQKIAGKHGVVRSTLTHKHRGEPRSREEAGLARRNLSPQ
jgi:hypothetical protein